jgi:hypothetical protein
MVVLAAALLGTAGAADASGLSWITSATATRDQLFNPYINAHPATPLSLVPDYGATVASGGSTAAPGSIVDLGMLVATQAETVTFTYLGSEAAYNDNLTLPNGASLHDHLPQALTGQSISEAVGAGIIPFEFQGQVNCPTLACGPWRTTAATRFADNGGGLHSPLWSSGPSFQASIGLIATNVTVLGVHYDYIIGYDDSAGDSRAFPSHDWDDMVIGVNAVPEPQDYALLFAGIGLMGYVARRRKGQRIV